MNDNEDFSGVKKGLPNPKTVDLTKIHYFLLFAILGVALCFIVFIFGYLVNTISPLVIPKSIANLASFLANVVGTIIYTAAVSFLVGIVQLVIFRGRIANRKIAYLSFSIMGGAVGGGIEGLILYLLGWFDFRVNTMFSERLMWSFIWSIVGLVLGAITGGIVGSVSSFMQNYVMKNASHRFNWFVYNLTSWLAIFGVGLALDLGFNTLIGFLSIGDAAAAIFMMLAHGMSMLVFLNYLPKFEFS